MITSKKVDAVVKCLEKVNDKYDVFVDMYEPFIKRDRPIQPDQELCGTVCCHAGAYLLGRRPFSSRIFNSYTRGATIMAHDLGFRNSAHLGTYMQDNPDIWGNEYGHRMFSSESAFHGCRMPMEIPTLGSIIEHWRGVADRLREREEQQKEAA